MCLVKWNHGSSGYIILCSSWAPISNKPQNFGILRICRIPKNIPHLCTSIATPLVLLEKDVQPGVVRKKFVVCYASLLECSIQFRKNHPCNMARSLLLHGTLRFQLLHDMIIFICHAFGLNSIVMENLQTWNSGNRENNVNSLASLCKLYTFWWANHVFSGHALQSGMDLF